MAIAVKRGTSEVADLMEALRERLGAKVVLCAVYLAEGKVRAITYPGMSEGAAERVVVAVAEALGDVQIVDLSEGSPERN